MNRPEVVIGIVGALGINMDLVTQAVQMVFSEVGYTSTLIRLSELLQEAEDPVPYDKEDLRRATLEKERVTLHMNAGNALRREMERGDALALLAIAAIRQTRLQHYGTENDENNERPIHNHVHILRSLKHPKEVETLREVYGASFFLFSAYAPKKERIRNMAKRIADSLSQFRPEGHEGEATSLLERDESEEEDNYGQQVRKTFWRGDAFVNTSGSLSLEQEMRRVTQLWFGHPFHTPTRDEYAMFCARAAALRSASLGRQVGAVIATTEGSIVSTGTNEVPKSGGGQYWSGDSPDSRDHVEGSDSSDTMRRELLTDLLHRMSKIGLLSENTTRATHEIVDDLLYGDPPVLETAEFNSLTEFQRPVHAEMSALIDAARRGVPVDKTTLYTTTFPCHGCARHVVAAGIERVVYIEPYAKSLATVLHSDSISVDESNPGAEKVVFEPFVGLAPARYMEFFSMAKRKDNRGKVITWKPLEAVPRLTGWENRLSVLNEPKFVQILKERQQSYASQKIKQENG